MKTVWAPDTVQQTLVLVIRKYPLIFCCALLFWVYSSFLEAKSFLPRGPITISLLDTGRAITKGSEYHLVNPAGFVHAPAGEVSGYYVFGQVPRNYWGISLSENSRLPLAASFIKELNSKSQFISISAASFIINGWSIGIGVTRWQKEESYWNAQIGTLIHPKGSSFSFGITWDYFLPIKGLFEGHRKYGLGIEYQITPHVFIRSDLVYKPKEQQWFIAGNGEIIFSRIFIFYLSGQMNFQTEELLYSGGAGLQGERMGLYYSLKRNLEERGNGWIHGITLTSRL